MHKIAQEFFNNNFVTLPKNIPFEKTDLYLYMKLMYGEGPVTANAGIIKVINTGDSYILSEHIYFDHFPGQGDSFFTLPSLELENAIIKKSSVGEALSRQGYAVIDIPKDFADSVLGKCKNLEFQLTSKDLGMAESFATFKYSKKMWDTETLCHNTEAEETVYKGIRNLLRDQISFSGILKSLNVYDLNVLKWKKGRWMDAHNDLDYKSFINFLNYNTDSCERSRELFVGEYDWYEMTWNALMMNNWDEFMNISKNKVQKFSSMVSTDKAILLNTFNPKFYHQVGEMKAEGDLYVCTSNMSFKEITSKFSLNW